MSTPSRREIISQHMKIAVLIMISVAMKQFSNVVPPIGL